MDDLTERIAARLRRPSVAELTRTMLALVDDGTLAPGTKLPTVRATAEHLGMSPSAVGQVWKRLRDLQVVTTRTKNGTTVLGAARAPRPVRFGTIDRARGTATTDLASPTPDPAFLPDLASAVAAVGGTTADLHDPRPALITDRLREQVAADWPIPDAAFLATHRNLDALELVLGIRVARGDRVAVEDPAVPRVLDLIELLGAVPVPVPWTADGPSLTDLRRALQRGARVFVYQPTVQAPTGGRVSARWAASAGVLLQDANALAVELDDYALMEDEAVSIGRTAPANTLRIRGYTNSHGHDAQLAVAGGAPAVVEAMARRLDYSARWVSRLLQDAMAHLLADPASLALVYSAADAYRARHAALLAALVERGVPSVTGDAPFAWVPVTDDVIVTERLARRRIAVFPARAFEVRAARERHILLNAVRAADDHDRYADEIAEAEAYARRAVKRIR